jgi:hypothetical protein
MDSKLGTACFKGMQEFHEFDYFSRNSSKVPAIIQQQIMTWISKEIQTQIKDSSNFHLIWQDGVNFCKLLSKILKLPDFKFNQGKNLNRSQIRVNLKKAFAVLRKCLEFKSEFLYSEGKVMEGNKSVIWGLLFDIKCFALMKSESFIDPGLVLNEEFLNEKSKVFNQYPKHEIQKNPRPKCKVLIEHIKKVKTWLVSLGIQDLVNIDNGHFFQNPYKNGVILNEILKIMKVPVQFIEEAYSKDEVLLNISNCIQAFKRFPGISFDNIDPLSILHGEEEAIWGFLLNLSLVFPCPVKPELNLYNQYQRNDLNKSLQKWMKGFGISKKFIENEICKECLFEMARSLHGLQDEEPLETLKRIFNLEEVYEVDLLEPDVILLFLENLHRLQDNVSLQLERDFSCSVYLGRGL